MTQQSAYLEGFCKIAEENGIDPYRLISFGLQKQAGKIPEPILNILNMKAPLSRFSGILTPEQQDLLTRFLIRSQRGVAKNQAVAKETAARFLRGNFPATPKGTQRTIDGALEQLRSLQKAETLPSTIRFYRQRTLGSWLRDLQGSGYFGGIEPSILGFESYGQALNPKFVNRKIKGGIGKGRREFFNMRPSKRRRALKYFNENRIPQTMTAEEVANQWTKGRLSLGD